MEVPDSRPADRFTWERQLRSSPEVTGTRLLVLMTLGTYMGPDGQGARPSQSSLAAATGLSERAVRGHLKAAVTDGWLILVQRGHRLWTGGAVASCYRAALPTGTPMPVEDTHATGTPVPVEENTTGTEEPVETQPAATQPAPRFHTTGTPVPPTMQDHLPTSSSPTTSVGEERDDEPLKGQVTPKRVLTEMARRRLGLAREQGAAWAPEEGCDPRRETGWLNKEFDALKSQYGFELDNLIAKWKPDQPAPAHQKWRNDPDWYVWKLDKALARRDWMQPTWQETREKLDRERAEYEAACAAADPDEVERQRQAARDLAERLKRENEEQRRHKLRLVTNEEQVPA